MKYKGPGFYCVEKHAPNILTWAPVFVKQNIDNIGKMFWKTFAEFYLNYL